MIGSSKTDFPLSIKEMGDCVNMERRLKMTDKIEVSIKSIDTSELDAALEKVNKLHKALLEAKTLLDELASKEINLSIKL